MDGQDFLRIVNESFTPFLGKIGFLMDRPSISGRSYRASFTGRKNSVWVSFEPGDGILVVYVFSLENGELSEIDDRLKTPRLADLNHRYMSSVTNQERSANEAVFQQVLVKDNHERALLKAAKDLRLVLPKYIESQSSTLGNHPKPANDNHLKTGQR